MPRIHPNLITEFQGLPLDWRITPTGDGFLEVELLTAANLTDLEIERAQAEAIEEWEE